MKEENILIKEKFENIVRSCDDEMVWFLKKVEKDLNYSTDVNKNRKIISSENIIEIFFSCMMKMMLSHRKPKKEAFRWGDEVIVLYSLGTKSTARCSGHNFLINLILNLTEQNVIWERISSWGTRYCTKE